MNLIKYKNYDLVFVISVNNDNIEKYWKFLVPKMFIFDDFSKQLCLELIRVQNTKNKKILIIFDEFVPHINLITVLFQYKIQIITIFNSSQLEGIKMIPIKSMWKHKIILDKLQLSKIC